jgi:hypothetical protein
MDNETQTKIEELAHILANVRLRQRLLGNSNGELTLETWNQISKDYGFELGSDVVSQAFDRRL